MTIQIIEPGELRTTADGSGIVGRIGKVGIDNDFTFAGNRSFRFETLGGTVTGAISASGETTGFLALAIGTPYSAQPTFKNVSSTVIRLVDKDNNTARTLQAAAFTAI